MDEKERSQFAEDLLDASLAQYSSVTPLPGLEGRVLANARAARERRVRFVWAGWLAAGAAAVVIAVAVLNFSRKQRVTVPPESVEPGKAAIAEESPSSPVHTFKLRPRAAGQPFIRAEQLATSGRVEDGPHLTVFPSPQPETAEEKLMSQYVRKSSPSALESFHADSTKIPDLEIKSLVIPPLANEVDETNNN